MIDIRQIERETFLNIPNMIDRADAVAAHHHSGQFRFDYVTPYIVHPRTVAANVKSLPWLKGSPEKQVALLHDVLEDTNCTLEELEKLGFSNEVVLAVDLLTKKEGQSYDDYLTLVKNNDLALTVKIADMLTNLNDTPTKNQVKKYAKGLLFLLS